MVPASMFTWRSMTTFLFCLFLDSNHRNKSWINVVMYIRVKGLFTEVNAVCVVPRDGFGGSDWGNRPLKSTK